MDLKGKITIFPERRKIKLEDGSEKEVLQIKGTISNKAEDGYKNKSVLVKLAGNNFPAEKVNMLKDDECYTLEVEKGFLGVEIYESKAGIKRDLSIVVLEGKLLDHKKVEKKPVEEKPVDKDLPF